MALVKRLINVTFQLAQGSFPGGSNTAKLEGLRVSAKITNAGGVAMPTAEVRIYGLTFSLMNQLSTLGLVVFQVPPDVITVEAGDAQNGMAVVFIGNIQSAYADFTGAPDVPFFVTAYGLYAGASAKALPTSSQGSADVATLMSGFATQMNVAFENNNVNVKLSNPVFTGSAREQALQCVKQADIEWNGGEGGVLAIWPRLGSRGAAIPLVSKDTGMIGYPAFNANGIMLKTLFNRSIKFGGTIQLGTSLNLDPRNLASGRVTNKWVVYNMNHDLESQVFNGRWQTEIFGYPPGTPPQAAQ